MFLLGFLCCPSCPKLFCTVVERNWKCLSSGWVLLIVHLRVSQLYFAQLHGVSFCVCSAYYLLTELEETLCEFLQFLFCIMTTTISPVLCHTNCIYLISLSACLSYHNSVRLPCSARVLLFTTVQDVSSSLKWMKL